MTVWDRVPGMEIRRPHNDGHRRSLYYIDNKRVSEGIWKRRYVRALEAELDELHAKLAAIYELI